MSADLERVLIECSGPGSPSPTIISIARTLGKKPSEIWNDIMILWTTKRLEREDIPVWYEENVDLHYDFDSLRFVVERSKLEEQVYLSQHPRALDALGDPNPENSKNESQQTSFDTTASDQGFGVNEERRQELLAQLNTPLPHFDMQGDHPKAERWGDRELPPWIQEDDQDLRILLSGGATLCRLVQHFDTHPVGTIIRMATDLTDEHPCLRKTFSATITGSTKKHWASKDWVLPKQVQQKLLDWGRRDLGWARIGRLLGMRSDSARNHFLRLDAWDGGKNLTATKNKTKAKQESTLPALLSTSAPRCLRLCFDDIYNDCSVNKIPEDIAYERGLSFEEVELIADWYIRRGTLDEQHRPKSCVGRRSKPDSLRRGHFDNFLSQLRSWEPSTKPLPFEVLLLERKRKLQRQRGLTVDWHDDEDVFWPFPFTGGGEDEDGEELQAWHLASGEYY